ncbi:hypothetical protein [Amycolatopsis plumensis]|uniref:Uncharacterized protein n=1 Tax=Amycolatopsis plumensis TaxID=236508 RepID=A0ABV5U993_9PSEU
MGQISLPTNILDRLKRVENQISRLWKAVGLSSATIAAGGLTLLNNAFLKMLGPTDNEILYIGPDGPNQVIRIRDGAGNIIFASVSGGGASQRVAINPNPGGPARIEFYDDASSSDRVSMTMFGANFVQQREAQDGSGITGGKVSFYSGNSVFGHQLNSTGADAYIRFYDDERVYIRGKWGTSDANGGHSALFVNSMSLGAGPITGVISYGATMLGTMRPIATRQGPLADCYWAVTASSATGFEVTASGGSSNTFHLWVFRT